jgi:ATP-binding cassette, subfamily C, bacterial CydD
MTNSAAGTPSRRPAAAAGFSPDARGWLKAAAAPGHARLRLAAACQTLETAFTVAQWAGLAWAAQDVLGRRALPAWPTLGLLVAGGLAAAAAAWGSARSAATGRQQIAAAIRKSLAAAALPARQRLNSGPDAATTALATVELVDDVAGYHAQALPLHASAPRSMAVVVAVTAAVQWPAAVVLAVGSLIIPLNMRLAGLFAAEGADEQVAASTRLTAVVLDSFRGVPTLRALGAVARRRGDLASAAAGLNAATMGVARRAFLSGAIMDVVITFAIAVDATYIGLSLAGYVHLHGTPHMTLFSGLLALLLCPMYFAPLRATAAAYHSREKALAAVPVISGLTAATPEAADAAEPAGRSVTGPVTVVVDDLALTFPGADRPVLHRVSLAARPGRWTAITGPSGAGKTTLLSLIAGMRQPDDGIVKWHTPHEAVPPHLGGCAWIGQQTVILPGSVSDNIRLGRPGATQAEVERAAAAAGLAGVAARLPRGLDTALGEGGFGLSAGEARRIAIARAFLRDADLWLLDEPTAHLDAESEAQVTAALHTATQGRTVIVATHSPALTRSADTVLTITGGTLRPVREVIPA